MNRSSPPYPDPVHAPGRPATGSAVTEGLGQAPVVRYWDTLLEQAVNWGASDIHLEPQAHGLRVRLRIDGRLREVAGPDASLREALVSRIKVLAKLDIAEKRQPQDGHISATLTGQSRQVALRISTLPTIHGEKVVARLLEQAANSLLLAQIGLEPEQHEALQHALAQAHGMILVTGPTGSGKTVTLYSCLQQLNRPDRNISTVEDPAEIRLEGITQVNINDKAGLDFSSVMRAMLRQDPDIIMVGEVRDSQTADIAIKAAQTGHLVLSTLHTKDAPSTLTRLVHMGIPAYQVASSVSLICAQRLLRRLCDRCKAPAMAPALDRPQLDRNHRTRFRAVGCDACVGGYKGRVGVFQVLPITEEIARAMLRGESPLAIGQLAQAAGTLTLRQAATRKADAGLTSWEEVCSQTAADPSGDTGEPT